MLCKVEHAEYASTWIRERKSFTVPFFNGGLQYRLQIQHQGQKLEIMLLNSILALLPHHPEVFLRRQPASKQCRFLDLLAIRCHFPAYSIHFSTIVCHI
ncbi:uncharacterized protein BDZ99DRAFT_430462 [Mytilinidion resinicola]|uniref:Uncharacterized protein n=1 Tax=Mytilinidion resinicola TaxID=574789 RepID=A0A6A6Z7Y5_9PEZI|nr:uncharacterized protein BDZ99DRAFT_430462 [Mytilinidion resinicola]KAF2816823.1 hypothetical protein BDZ99DRAFT_430462 [Mytilinidion resinicola]